MPRNRRSRGSNNNSTAPAKTTTVNSSATNVSREPVNQTKHVPREPVNQTKHVPRQPVYGIDQLFYTYANKSSGLIEPEGIESLCSDLGVDHTDVRILMLAWKMEAKKQGYFTLDEWRRALKAFNAETLVLLKKSLVSLVKEVKNESSFRDFYSYAFSYCLMEDKQKFIEIESVCELLKIVLGSDYPQQVEALTQYLEAQEDYKVINMDQWMGFYRFISEVNFPDLDNYDPMVAWPSILDNFVDWMSSKQG